MAYYGHTGPSSNASDVSSSSSVSVGGRHQNNSTATSSTSPHALELPSDSDDPSFSSQRVVTSTPRKSRTSYREEEEERDQTEDDLRLSDTESLEPLDDQAIERGMERFEEEQRLTRRSLATHLKERDSLLQPYYSNSLTPRGITVPQMKFTRGELYAPSPSTGSSTLVEREEEGFAKFRNEGETTVRRGGKGVTRTTLERDVVYENEEEEEDQRTEIQSFSSARNRPDEQQQEEEEGGSSSSPRPSNRRSTVGDLATYIDARLSHSTPSNSTTPRRSPKSRRQLSSSTLPPQTPHAPGAFPLSARKTKTSPGASAETPVRSQLSSSSNRQKTPPSNGSSSAQIHDAFARYITGPKGALTNSAERRMAMQQATSSSLSTPGPGSREKLEMPDFAGRYSFVPSSALPVEKQRRKEINGEARPTNLETALRRVGEREEENEFVRRRRQEYDQERVRESEAVEREEEDIPASEEDEIRIAQRSAIDFAMARDETEEDASTEESPPPTEDRPLHAELRNSVRFVEPASPPKRARTPSPPPRPLERSRTTPARQLRAPSPELPDLPPLPPVLAPDSPEPIRSLPPSSSFRRSHSVSRRQSSLRDPIVPLDSPATPPRQPIFEPRSPSPPRSPIHLDPPKSSTPPRRTVQPPNPDATPPRASPSPLARRLVKTSPPSPPSEPVFTPQPIDSEEQVPEEDPSIPLLVNQLSAAVRALTAAHASPKSSPRKVRQSSVVASNDELAKQLTRRKEESERKRKELEEELMQLESREQAEISQRNDVVRQLAETYEIEHELGSKVEELRKSIAEMGQLVGDQVAQAVHETLHQESRKRAHWLALAFCFQLGLFWLVLRLANARSLSLLDSSYYDPFKPHEFSLLLSPYTEDVPLHPDTIALFTPYVSSHSSWSGIETTASILRGSVEKFGKFATKWGSDSKSLWTAGARSVKAMPSARSVPI
ncbi:uncharacterized protein JCM6883_007227 [Sporobolomyces salmoneus]|uniref:uncharacterized protein n=1 Tax=Sporobolomyces salmoneus TaxID=183962 RepID=UPI003181B5C4